MSSRLVIIPIAIAVIAMVLVVGVVSGQITLHSSSATSTTQSSEQTTSSLFSSLTTITPTTSSSLSSTSSISTADSTSTVDSSSTTTSSYSSSSSSYSSTTSTSSTTLSSSTLTSSTTSSQTTSDTVSSITTRQPVFIWMFGYIGDTFWPGANNSITPQETISAAANMSKEFGYQNLRLVNSIDVEPGHNIQAGNISAIHAYVQQLRNYAAYVYGRIQAPQFPNQTAMYNEAYLFYKEIGVNGIFIDLAPILYQGIGQAQYNKIMQNLTDSFPGINFMMNYASKSLPPETPLSGTTWGSYTYIMPTVPSGQYTYDSVNISKIVELNQIFPGRVLLHYDANAGLGSGEPMAVFADQSATNEISALSTLIQNGLTPPSCPSSNSALCKYDFLVPVLGAWTSNTSQYGGTLYNSFTVGKYARSTFYDITSLLQKNDVEATPLSYVQTQGAAVQLFTFGTVIVCILGIALWSNRLGTSRSVLHTPSKV